MSVGDVFLPDPNPKKPSLPLLDPRGAAALALKNYIETFTFRRWGGEAPDTFFKLKNVFDEWPEPDKLLNYPSASITDAAPVESGAHSFIPTPLEETQDEFCPDTVLWKVSEAQIQFQLDFFADDAPTREAIAALLPRMFSPANDERTGVVLCGSEHYFRRPVRVTLLRYRRMDSEGSSYPRERRLMVELRAEIDEVDLRCSTRLAPRVNVDPVGPGVDVGTVPGEPFPPHC